MAYRKVGKKTGAIAPNKAAKSSKGKGKGKGGPGQLLPKEKPEVVTFNESTVEAINKAGPPGHEVAHINPREGRLLEALGGSGEKDPETKIKSYAIVGSKKGNKLPKGEGRGRVDSTHQVAVLTDLEAEALNTLRWKDKDRGFSSGSGPEIQALADQNDRPFDFVEYRGEVIPTLNDSGTGYVDTSTGSSGGGEDAWLEGVLALIEEERLKEEAAAAKAAKEAKEKREREAAAAKEAKEKKEREEREARERREQQAAEEEARRIQAAKDKKAKIEREKKEREEREARERREQQAREDEQRRIEKAAEEKRKREEREEKEAIARAKKEKEEKEAARIEQERKDKEEADRIEREAQEQAEREYKERQEREKKEEEERQAQIDANLELLQTHGFDETDEYLEGEGSYGTEEPYPEDYMLDEDEDTYSSSQDDPSGQPEDEGDFWSDLGEYAGGDDWLEGEGEYGTDDPYAPIEEEKDSVTLEEEAEDEESDFNWETQPDDDDTDTFEDSGYFDYLDDIEPDDDDTDTDDTSGYDPSLENIHYGEDDDEDTFDSNEDAGGTTIYDPYVGEGEDDLGNEEIDPTDDPDGSGADDPIVIPDDNDDDDTLDDTDTTTTDDSTALSADEKSDLLADLDKKYKGYTATDYEDLFRNEFKDDLQEDFDAATKGLEMAFLQSGDASEFNTRGDTVNTQLDALGELLEGSEQEYLDKMAGDFASNPNQAIENWYQTQKDKIANARKDKDGNLIGDYGWDELDLSEWSDPSETYDPEFFQDVDYEKQYDDPDKVYYGSIEDGTDPVPIYSESYPDPDSLDVGPSTETSGDDPVPDDFEDEGDDQMGDDWGDETLEGFDFGDEYPEGYVDPDTEPSLGPPEGRFMSKDMFEEKYPDQEYPTTDSTSDAGGSMPYGWEIPVSGGKHPEVETEPSLGPPEDLILSWDDLDDTWQEDVVEDVVEDTGLETALTAPAPIPAPIKQPGFNADGSPEGRSAPGMVEWEIPVSGGKHPTDSTSDAGGSMPYGWEIPVSGGKHPEVETEPSLGPPKDMFPPPKKKKKKTGPGAGPGGGAYVRTKPLTGGPGLGPPRF